MSIRLNIKTQARRSYFDEDTEFDDSLIHVVNAYERAAINATNSARLAIKSTNQEDIKQAVWHEAVCSALEACLGSLSDGKKFYDTELNY